jgi:HAE1 family hydrophobic/amphiphilic exporter-1
MLTQNRVAQASPFLPPEVTALGVTTKKITHVSVDACFNVFSKKFL